MIQQQDGSSFAYDAENRQIAFCPNDLPATCTQTAGNNRTLYYYDGTGKRVLSAGPGGAQTFVYDASGNLAVEYGSESAGCTTCYLTTDHLGSTRVVSDQNGCAVFRQDYMPFGETIMRTGSGSNGGPHCVSTDGYQSTTVPARQQFTGQERDVESGNDFFQARYYSSSAGRFMSADPAGNFWLMSRSRRAGTCTAMGIAR